MNEQFSCYAIIYESEDDDGNIRYYVTKDSFDHSWLCEVDINDLDEIHDDFEVSYMRKTGNDSS